MNKDYVSTFTQSNRDLDLAVHKQIVMEMINKETKKDIERMKK